MTTHATGDITEELATYVHGLRYDQLPEEVVLQAKRLILDNLGCQLGGATLEPGKRIIEYVSGLGDRPEASVVGTDLKVSCFDAALANATLAHSDELDESLVEVGHVSSMLVPTILAVGEKEGVSGRDLIVALVAGYDVAGRLGRCGLATTPVWNRLALYAGLLGGGIWTSIAAGKLLNLSVEQLRMALGIAGCQAGGQGSDRSEPQHMTKAYLKGAVASDGITAAYLARIDFRGPLSLFEGPHNFLRSYVGDAARPEELITGLGRDFPILTTSLKLYSAGHPIHGPVFGTLKIMSEHTISAADIEEITVRLAAFELQRVDDDPTMSVNLRYCLAVAVLDRRLLWEQFSPARQADPAVEAFGRRIHSVHEPRLDEIQARTRSKAAIVELRTKDGRVFQEEVLYPPGEPRNPASPKQLEEKFFWLATKRLTEHQARRLFDVVNRLEGLDDARTLGDLVRIRS